ncbi:hypothetical protein [Streptosporangium sp. NPDC002524]|uniref:hypothetical protein n=1 Tax=Streptosporangium sp. NPDC002524 TaxID=3154537 RepID=UPI00332A2C12
MYYDPDQHDRRDPDQNPDQERLRVLRDVAGLVLLALGAILTVIGAVLWLPPAALVALGVVLLAAGWVTSTGRNN